MNLQNYLTLVAEGIAVLGIIFTVVNFALFVETHSNLNLSSETAAVNFDLGIKEVMESEKETPLQVTPIKTPQAVPQVTPTVPSTGSVKNRRSLHKLTGKTIKATLAKDNELRAKVEALLNRKYYKAKASQLKEAYLKVV